MTSNVNRDTLELGFEKLMLNLDPSKIYVHSRDHQYRYQILWFDDNVSSLVTRSFKNGAIELWNYSVHKGRFVETEEDVFESEDYRLCMQELARQRPQLVEDFGKARPRKLTTWGTSPAKQTIWIETEAPVEVSPSVLPVTSASEAIVDF